LEDECELSHLEAILRGLALNTSTMQKLFLPSLPVNQLILLSNALPKFTHLIAVEFAAETMPLFLQRKLVLAFKRNGSLITSMTKCPMTDYQNNSNKLTAYHTRNKYLPMSVESAVENKTTEKIDYGPGEFSFHLVPSLLRATIDATFEAQGPTRVVDVLKRCKDRIGPLDC
jgi:hypothetical protein